MTSTAFRRKGGGGREEGGYCIPGVAEQRRRGVEHGE